VQPFRKLAVDDFLQSLKGIETFLQTPGYAFATGFAFAPCRARNTTPTVRPPGTARTNRTTRTTLTDRTTGTDRTARTARTDRTARTARTDQTTGIAHTNQTPGTAHTDQTPGTARTDQTTGTALTDRTAATRAARTDRTAWTTLTDRTAGNVLPISCQRKRMNFTLEAAAAGAAGAGAGDVKKTQYAQTLWEGPFEVFVALKNILRDNTLIRLLLPEIRAPVARAFGSTRALVDDTWQRFCLTA
jgi:hypothetical protein